MTLAQLDAMRNTTEIDRTKLVDIQSVKINPSLPAAQRAERYLEQIKNPYCFLCGGSVVRLRFADGGEDLRARLKNYFTSCKKA